MIRLNRYCSPKTMLPVVCDMLALFIAFVGACLISFVHSGNSGLPAAQGVSLLAGLLVINTASGLYGSSRRRSVNQWWRRAVLALVLGLLLSYTVLGLLPPESVDLTKVRWLTMLCVVAVVAHRVYAGYGGATSRSSKVLIVGAGASAELVGRTIGLANRHLEVVGYVPGPNELKSTAHTG